LRGSRRHSRPSVKARGKSDFRSLPKCAILSKIRPDVVPAVLEAITWVPWDQGIEILGCPVGSAGFVQRHLDKVLAKLESAMARGMSLGDPHSSSLLLRSCLGAGKVNHLLRCLPPPGRGGFRETLERPGSGGMVAIDGL
jgi:hypothetical protein